MALRDKFGWPSKRIVSINQRRGESRIATQRKSDREQLPPHVIERIEVGSRLDLDLFRYVRDEIGV